MKLLTLFSATFWTLTNAVDDLEIDAELEAGHRRLGFERLRLITSKKDAIAATEIDGNAGSSKVPFRIKGSDAIAGTVYQTVITRSDGCTGFGIIQFKNLMDSITFTFECSDAPQAITGGTGKYIGAGGEITISGKNDKQTAFVKVMTLV